MKADDADSTEQPGREERRAVILAGWLIRNDGSTCNLHVVDLSYCGCKIQCDAPLQLGELVRISVPQRGLVEAEVRWRSQGEAGLAFSDTAPTKTYWPRRVNRTRVSIEIKLRRYGKTAYKVHLFDLSTDGCKVEFVDKPQVDERVWVKVPGIEAVEAEVCWLDGYVGGLRFSKRYHPAVLDFVFAKLEG